MTNRKPRRRNTSKAAARIATFRDTIQSQPQPPRRQLADPQPRGPLLPKLPPGAVRVQPRRPKSRAARRGGHHA